MNNHTPGPWKVGDGFYIHKTSVYGEKSRRVAACETEEDAVLIAEAPEMFEALMAIIEEAGPSYGLDDGPGTINRIARLARAAVAKITGRA